MSSRTSPCRWLKPAIVCALMVVAAPGGAQPAAPADDDKVARSVSHATAGLELYNRGSFAEAYDKFYLAEQLAHSPVFTLYLARCKAALGELLAARKHFTSVEKEPLGEDAPATWVQAQKDAAAEGSALSARIPSLRLVVSSTRAATTLDGRPLTTDRVEVDPGEHRVAAILGERRVERVVVVAEAERDKEVVLTLPPPAQAATVDNGSAKGPLWPGITLTSVGLVGVGVGALFGGLALSLDDDLSQVCDAQSRCPAESEGDLDRLDTYEVVSTVGLIGGGLVGALGVALLVWRPGGEDKITAQIYADRASVTLRW